jgi:hypothetical protein
MGVNIDGRVEIQNAFFEQPERNDWHAVIDAGFILDRDYTMFGSMFGVRNSTSFAPVAANRGLPADASEDLEALAIAEGNHSHTWITWNELQAVNWDEVGLVYGTDQISRRDALGPAGILLLEMMKPLVERYGGDCVRLVVWFDNYN